MEKIKMPNPIVEMDGDEMTRILWGMIKEELILPFVELNTEYYDLCLPNRDETDDQVTVEAAEAIKRHARGREVRHHHPQPPAAWRSTASSQMWKSPNATIRAALDGTVFRAPILISGHQARWSPAGRSPSPSPVTPTATCTRPWSTASPGAGKAELVFTDENGEELPARPSMISRAPAWCRAMHNRDASILSFARCCFAYALSVEPGRVVLRQGHHLQGLRPDASRLLFQKVFDEEYKDAPLKPPGLHLSLRPHRRRGRARSSAPRAA